MAAISPAMSSAWPRPSIWQGPAITVRGASLPKVTAPGPEPTSTRRWAAATAQPAFLPRSAPSLRITASQTSLAAMAKKKAIRMSLTR